MLFTTRNRFEINSRDQVDDVAYQLYLPRAIPSLSCNFIPFQEVDKLEVTKFFLRETWSMNYKCY